MLTVEMGTEYLTEQILFTYIKQTINEGVDKVIAFEVRGVKTEVYKKVLLDDISFTLQPGEVLALVGHNGAGKSTLMKTMMHVMEKRAGRIIIQEEFDQDKQLLAFKKHITYLPEEPLLLTELTVMQHFQLYALSYDIAEEEFEAKLARYVDGFGLTTKLDAYPEELSKGMRQKVQTICAFLPDVPVMLIDEPFMGLDIYAVEFLLMLLKEKIASGMCIVLTTHQLDQVKNLAHTFMLLEDGKVKSTGDIADFTTITRGFQDD